MALRKEIIDACVVIANAFGLPTRNLLGFISVESGGSGFAENGKITIQFEPSWFKKNAPYAPSGKWSVNGVERQAAEWEAFNSAFAVNPNAAMMSTSIGLGQILGLHYKRLGYKAVGAMWDDAKKGEFQQIEQIAKFIKSDAKLYAAVKSGNAHLMAYYYNGSGYKALAKKIGREPYDLSIAKAIAYYKGLGL